MSPDLIRADHRRVAAYAADARLNSELPGSGSISPFARTKMISLKLAVEYPTAVSRPCWSRTWSPTSIGQISKRSRTWSAASWRGIRYQPWVRRCRRPATIHAGVRASNHSLVGLRYRLRRTAGIVMATTDQRSPVVSDRGSISSRDQPAKSRQAQSQVCDRSPRQSSMLELYGESRPSRSRVGQDPPYSAGGRSGVGAVSAEKCRPKV
jgi:hypothetical protein